MATKKRETPYPVKKWVVPAELKAYENGKLPENILTPIRGGGKLWEVAAADWNRMARAAKRDGVEIKNVSRGYRAYATQLAMWVDRWQRRRSPRKPEVTKVWNQEIWWLRQGKSPSAVPGTSPHGWGCAQDIAHRDTKLFRWMCNNAPKYNFWLQAEKGSPFQEDWHWHWIKPTNVVQSPN
jgi:LAS superfamily LD-carboxypeptidase LdcB